MVNKVNVKKSRSKLVMIIAAAVLLIAAGGFAYYHFSSQKAAATAQASTTDSQTATARRGSLVISADGSGTLVARKQADLAFSSSGTIGSLDVKVGDKVTEGQQLAQLQDLSSLQSKVNEAQLSLMSAKQALEDLQNNTAEALAQAKLDLVDAQETYDDAKNAVVTDNMTRCDEDTITVYYEQYMDIQNQLDNMKNPTNDPYIYVNQIKPVESERDTAYSKYMYCLGYSDYEVESSQANLTIAEAAVETAQTKLETLQANNGIDPDELAAAQNTVDSAQIALNDAQKALDGATLTAPFDGTILSISAEAGDSIGTSTFISMADLTSLDVDFYVDESDMDNVAVGYDAEVTFDAIDGQTFNGAVTEVDPMLTTSGNYNMLHGVIEITLTQDQLSLNIPLGLSASVSVIGGRADNAVLIPVEALKDMGDGTYGVFVVSSDGSLTYTPVEVGLMDYTYAAITSGLNAGDVVSTGNVETN